MVQMDVEKDMKCGVVQGKTKHETAAVNNHVLQQGKPIYTHAEEKTVYCAHSTQ